MYEILAKMEAAAMRAELAAAYAARDRKATAEMLDEVRREATRAAGYRRACGRLVRHHADFDVALRDGELEVNYE